MTVPVHSNVSPDFFNSNVVTEFICEKNSKEKKQKNCDLPDSNQRPRDICGSPLTAWTCNNNLYSTIVSTGMGTKI